MATVIGMTAARGEEIDARHIASGTIVDGDLVLTRQNAEEISIPMPPAGSPLGISRFQTPTVYQSVISGNSAAYFDMWDETILHGISLGLDSPADSNTWTFAEAGWYQVTFNLWLGFTAVTSPLPDSAILQFTTWIGMQLRHEVPLSAALGSFANRTEHGGQATLTAPAYYYPGAVAAPLLDGPNNLSVLWTGDAVLKTGMGAAASGGNAVTMTVSRLA